MIERDAWQNTCLNSNNGRKNSPVRNWRQPSEIGSVGCLSEIRIVQIGRTSLTLTESSYQILRKKAMQERRTDSSDHHFRCFQGPLALVRIWKRCMTSFKARKAMLCKSMCCEIVENGTIPRLNSSDRRFWSFQASLALNCVGKGSLTSFPCTRIDSL
jgi:hypothetical protein